MTSTREQPVWSEEELREIAPEPRPARTGAASLAGALRRELSALNVRRAALFPHELTGGSPPVVIYEPCPEIVRHGNFMEASYRGICADPEWSGRLRKAHTSKGRARLTTARVDEWCELDSANSSDALLMNIFCYPRVLAMGRLAALLGVNRELEPEFGFKPRVPLQRGLTDTSEIDMKLGTLLVEAKLTEGDFQHAPLRKLERYRDFHAVFDQDLLRAGRDGVASYQLIRGVLAAYATDASFCVLCDARRPDLIEAWYGVMRSVHSFELQSRLRLLTWQEIAGAVPGPLAEFLNEKYGIAAA